jgi:hypothetical protein
VAERFVIEDEDLEDEDELAEDRVSYDECDYYEDTDGCLRYETFKSSLLDDPEDM